MTVAATLGLPRARAWARRHPGRVDAMLAAGVYVVLTFAITSAAETRHEHGSLTGALLDAVLVGPLVVRRTHPLAVLTTITGAAALISLTFGPTGGEVSVLVALATVVALVESTRRAALASVIVSSLLVGVVLRRAPEPLQPLVAGLALVAAAVATGIAVRSWRTQRILQLDRDARRRREHLRDAELVVAAERSRIAREIHDIVTHNVSVMIALADGAQQVLTTSPGRADEAIGQVATVGREALAELRGLVEVLREDDAAADLTPQPHLRQLDDLVDRVEAAGLPARLMVEGSAPPLTPLLELTLYRITQEALTNVLRHGRAVSQVHVRLTWASDAAELEVVDDGSPSPPARRTDLGRGIAGMRERAALYGAPLTAGPSPDAGWRVATRLPLSAPESP